MRGRSWRPCGRHGLATTKHSNTHNFRKAAISLPWQCILQGASDLVSWALILDSKLLQRLRINGWEQVGWVKACWTCILCGTSPQVEERKCSDCNAALNDTKSRTHSSP